MKVLMITGDRHFGPGHERYELQKAAVETLAVVYWGLGSLWPKIPTGRFDVVTVQDPFWRGLFGLWVSKRKGAKLNVQVHTDLSVYSGVKHVLMQIVLQRADSVRVVSEKIKTQVEHIAKDAHVSVLPVFVDIERFANLVPEAHEKPTILWIGRFEDEKDPLLAVEVLRQVLAAGTEARLVMLGRGSLGEDIEEEAKGMPVDVVGWQDPLPLLARADVVLSTSKHESFGASIVEALAAGVPVVAPDVGIAKEAGATIAPRSELQKAVRDVLMSKAKGQLRIAFLDKETWAKQWAASLL